MPRTKEEDDRWVPQKNWGYNPPVKEGTMTAEFRAFKKATKRIESAPK